MPVILIDDARMFLGPLPPPHDSAKWPRIDEVFLLLKNQFPGSLVTIADDVIYSIPPDLIEVFNNDWTAQFGRRFGTGKRTLFTRVLNKLNK
jgi:hypothetical protein